MLDSGLPMAELPPAVPEAYRYGARRLRFTSVYVPLDERRVQAVFVPADARTRRLLEAVPARP